MMAAGKQNGMAMMVMVTMMMAVAMLVVESEGYECTVMRGDCRLVMNFEEDEMVTRNISCYCEHGEEVSRPLQMLAGSKCLHAPGREVNVSILHINGCKVSQVFPESLMAACRTSLHLVVYVKDSPYLSLPSQSYTKSRTSPAPRTITANFIHSNVSGMPEGVVSGAVERARVKVEGGKMGVLESRSFSGYPRDAQVSVSFKDTEILTVKQGAFDLPPTTQLNVEGGKMVRFETHSYSGGAKLSLSGVVVGILMSSAVNIYGLMKLSVVNCTIAAVYANAFTHRPPTYDRTITGGQEVLEGSEAIFSGNKLSSGNGEAFARLCTVDKLSWQNNYVQGFSDMPLRFQDAGCATERDWAQVFSFNGLSCVNCTDFANPDEQSCGLYESGHCIGCEKDMDSCNKPILPYLTDKCRASDPDIARDLKNTCNINASKRTAKALPVQNNEEETDASTSLMPLSSLVTLAVAMLVVAPE